MRRVSLHGRPACARCMRPFRRGWYFLIIRVDTKLVRVCSSTACFSFSEDLLVDEGQFVREQSPA